MPIKRYFIIGIAALLLSGCSVENTGKENNTSEAVSASENETKTESTDTTSQTFQDSPQAPDDSNLTEVGKTLEDADGIITLNQYANLNETKQIGDITMTIADVKVMNLRPSPDLVDYFHGFTHQEVEFPYVRVNVKVKNNSKETLNFAPVAKLTTDQGETVTWEDDFYLEKLNGELKPGEEKVGSLAFIIDESTPEELKSLSIQTSEVFDDKEKKVGKTEEFQIGF
ncbi:DUF4352 domain-containing protein [Bacillus sp. CHD6a]|uniref:DUF4352 domain-containing protein n=1 Tax=Bacillus sp. CHD6a TaxID=1643452 RepID=UPI0006CCD15E|nr:DUF4352 domain-containing protein [Bacillus sp. CHD6a]KPB04055.1 hypothetical protein AAV98_13560 [Bacillus sp. CHD6a]